MMHLREKKISQKIDFRIFLFFVKKLIFCVGESSRDHTPVIFYRTAFVLYKNIII